MKLKIRLLESPPETEPKLLQQVQIYPDQLYGLDPCVGWSLTLTSNDTITPKISESDTFAIVAAFVHKYRLFYINENEAHHDILTDSGKFFTSLPSYFAKYFSWRYADFISYDDILLVVSLNYGSSLNALLNSTDFFREYELIPCNEHLSDYAQTQPLNSNRIKNVFIFESEALAITERGAQFYDGQSWDDFAMKWTNMGGFLDSITQFMVIHTIEGDHLFAFSQPSGN